MSDERVLRMPIRRFWLMSRNIQRISAERDMRSLTVGAVAQGGQEAIEAYRRSLTLEIGQVVVQEEKFDAAGWARLKAMAGQKVGAA